MNRLLLLLLFIGVTDAFIPHPLLAYGAMATNSRCELRSLFSCVCVSSRRLGLTHSEITGLGFVRSLARYLYETQIFQSRSNSSQPISDEEFLTTKYTINDLYKLAHPELDRFDIELYTLPVKFILDTLMTQNVLVDFNPKTKKLSAAHFDSEAFLNGSRRILRLRQNGQSECLRRLSDSLLSFAFHSDSRCHEYEQQSHSSPDLSRTVVSHSTRLLFAFQLD